jgi:hypothetical protein
VLPTGSRAKRPLTRATTATKDPVRVPCCPAAADPDLNA